MNRKRHKDATKSQPEATALINQEPRIASAACGATEKPGRTAGGSHPGQAASRHHAGEAGSGPVTDQPRATHPSDADLARLASLALEQSGLASGDQIKVIVRDGRLVLHGEVDIPSRKQAIAAVVEGLSGTQGICNNIVVVNDALADRVHRQIVDDFMFDARVEACRIVVLAYDRTIVLTGSTCSEARRKQAETVAWEVPGTEAVFNRIRLSAK